VIILTQGEEEGMDQAWNRFNELIKQGPRLDFSGDVLLHTFFFALTPSYMEHVQMCHGENTHGSRSTFTKDSKSAAMRRDWEIYMGRGRLRTYHAIEQTIILFFISKPYFCNPFASFFVSIVI
jgi:hypothetical protein